MLNVNRFRNAFFLPPNHPNRPHVALLNAVFLWAVRLYRAPNFNVIESFYLNRALTSLPDALQSGVNAQLYTIQAESLLALHFYYQGRFLEGRYHADAAVSITMSLRLHKVGSTALPPAPAIGFNIPTGNGDHVAKGEKINLFWMVFNLDKCWSVAFGLPSVLPDDRSEANSIDTPWPLSMDDYEQVSTHIMFALVHLTSLVFRVRFRIPAEIQCWRSCFRILRVGMFNRCYH